MKKLIEHQLVAVQASLNSLVAYIGSLEEIAPVEGAKAMSELGRVHWTLEKIRLDDWSASVYLTKHPRTKEPGSPPVAQLKDNDGQ